MDIYEPIRYLKESLDGSEHDHNGRFPRRIYLDDGRIANLLLILRIDDEDDHREYLEYKREIMEMDEASAAKGDD